MAKMAEKPIILNDNQSLVECDLKNVYNHFLSGDLSVCQSKEVKFKKKETIEEMKKSVLKHRIRILTGKDLSLIETELGKSIETDSDLKNLARLMILEATENLSVAPAPKEKEQPPSGRKRNFTEDFEVEEPRKKRGRKSIAVSSLTQPTMDTLNTNKRTRRSMMPVVSSEKHNEEEEAEVENIVEEDLDITDLGPNPTPQMIELKRKKLKGNRKSVAVEPKTNNPIKSSVLPKKKVEPARNGFSGVGGCSIYLVEADIAEKSHGCLDYTRLQKSIPDFPGANLVLIHTPVDWSPTDVFAVSMNVKLLNRRANQDMFLLMVGCGIQNINLLYDALHRHTKHVQCLVFEREDMNLDAKSNDFMLRGTTSLFLLAYIFPGCDKEESLPPSRMVRPNLTTCFKTKDIEDLENTIIHAFSEEGDWILDICCGGRELTLAAQKCGRNAIAFDAEEHKLEELSEKAAAIAKYHDSKFRPGVDGKVITY